MVTVEEAQQQLVQQEQQLVQARKQIESYPTQVQYTKAQLYSATPQSQIQVREVQRQRAIEKGRAMSELQAQEQQFKVEAERVRGEIAAAQAAEAEYARQMAEYEKARGVRHGETQTTVSEVRARKAAYEASKLVEPTKPTLTVSTDLYKAMADAARAGSQKYKDIFTSNIIVQTPSPIIETPKKQTAIQQIGNLLFGEAGKGLVGVGITGFPPIVTYQQIKEQVRKIPIGITSPIGLNLPYTYTTLPSKVAAEFIPTTPGEIAILGTSFPVYKVLPPVAKTALSTGISYLGFKGASAEDLPIEKRIASGIVGGLGALGVISEFSQQYKNYQIESLKATKPEVSAGKPLQIGEDIYLQQVAEKRIPYPGFTYTPKPFVAEPTLTGTSFISPRQVTPMIARLVPTENGGFTFTGIAKTGVNIVKPLTGTYEKIITPSYEFFGKVKPEEAARLITPKYTLGNIEQPYVGKVTLESKPIIKEYFGGFPVKQTETGTRIISGGIQKLRYYPISERGQLIPIPKVRAVMESKTLALILPEKSTKPITFFPTGTKAQTALTFETPKPTIEFQPVKLGNVEIVSQLIGQRVGDISTQLINIPKTEFQPLFKLILPEKQITIQPTLQVQTPKQISIQKQVPKTIPISKQINFEVQIPKQISSQVLVPGQVQIQLPRQIQLQRQSPISMEMNLLYPVKPFLTSPSTKKVTIKKMKALQAKLAYQIFIRKKGKFILATKKTMPLGMAKKFGVRRVKSGVAQTFKLIPRGTTALQDIMYEVPGRLFTTPKTIPPAQFQYTERRGKTLTEFPEVKELQMFKRRSSKKIRLL